MKSSKQLKSSITRHLVDTKGYQGQLKKIKQHHQWKGLKTGVKNCVITQK